MCVCVCGGSYSDNLYLVAKKSLGKGVKIKQIIIWIRLCWYVCSDKSEFKNISLGVTKLLEFGLEICLSGPNLSVYLNLIEFDVIQFVPIPFYTAPLYKELLKGI